MSAAANERGTGLGSARISQPSSLALLPSSHRSSASSTPSPQMVASFLLLAVKLMCGGLLCAQLFSAMHLGLYPIFTPWPCEAKSSALVGRARRPAACDDRFAAQTFAVVEFGAANLHHKRGSRARGFSSGHSSAIC